MTEENERPSCPECGWQPSLPGMLNNKILHDGEGHYYLARCCPECEWIEMRLIPEYDDGFDIKPEFKENAEIDPEPPEITAKD